MRSSLAWLFTLAQSAAQATQPWLDTTLPYEERLLSFISQLNEEQKYAMVQGDTEVRLLARLHATPLTTTYLSDRAHLIAVDRQRNWGQCLYWTHCGKFQHRNT